MMAAERRDQIMVTTVWVQAGRMHEAVGALRLGEHEPIVIMRAGDWMEIQHALRAASAVLANAGPGRN